MIRYTAVLSAIVFALALPSAAQAACPRWTVLGSFWGAQSNNYAVKFELQQNGGSLRGNATSVHYYQRWDIKARGSADGAITGNNFQLTVYWNNQTIGVYEGRINPQGRIDGTAYDRRHPNSRATWYSEALMVCARS